MRAGPNTHASRRFLSQQPLRPRQAEAVNRQRTSPRSPTCEKGRRPRRRILIRQPRRRRRLARLPAPRRRRISGRISPGAALGMISYCDEPTPHESRVVTKVVPHLRREFFAVRRRIWHSRTRGACSAPRPTRRKCRSTRPAAPSFRHRREIVIKISPTADRSRWTLRSKPGDEVSGRRLRATWRRRPQEHGVGIALHVFRYGQSGWRCGAFATPAKHPTILSDSRCTRYSHHENSA